MHVMMTGFSSLFWAWGSYRAEHPPRERIMQSMICLGASRTHRLQPMYNTHDAVRHIIGA